jgi:hypothetical protein
MFGHLQGQTTGRRIYDYIRNHWREWFPALPTYQAFNCRLNEQASRHDLQSLREMRPSLPEGCGLFADKAYFHHETQQNCKERGWFLVASYKRHRHEAERDVPTLYNRFVWTIRRPLESLFGWIIQKTDLQNASRVRSTQGLKLHCYGKLAVACLLLTLYS